MQDLISKIINGRDVEKICKQIISNLYQNGPNNSTDMEILCYINIYQPEIFDKYKNLILKYMGLNYKNIESSSLPEIVFGMYEKYIKEEYQYNYTPVQAMIVKGINNNQCFSFSAPTSTGKSFVFRNIIKESYRDIVIIVPSRALINEYYYTLCNLIKDKSVNILTFIDRINTKNAKRNVFIVTPERCKEIFKRKNEFDVEVFLFDEAQLSDEDSFRGLYFDSIIRRIQRAYPNSKFIFAHPFVMNPEAQIKKNHFDRDVSDFSFFNYRNVGQMFYAYDKGNYYHFGIDKKIMGNHKILCKYDPLEEILKRDGSILVYTTKTSIYNKSVFNQFKKYIDLCSEIIDENAKRYIDEIKKYIGASDIVGRDRFSQMISLLKRGIVIHHGSLPLHARLLIERFTQKGYCRICFATSTLEQGINMPFDVVFLNTFRESNPLSLKNLIGRAGRSSTMKKFDYGSIVVKLDNMSQLRNIMGREIELNTVSMLEQEVDVDLSEFKEAILEGTLSDEYNITNTQIEKLTSNDAVDTIKNILNSFIEDENIISLKRVNNDDYFDLDIYSNFQKLYEIYLSRSLSDGEKNIFNTAIKIMLWQIHCKTFQEICFLRYAYASKKQQRDILQKIIETGNISEKNGAKKKLDSLYASFITQAAEIPNKNIKVYSMFGNNKIKAVDVDYDRIVFDTYDYLDKIIGFKLSDVFIAAFEEYYNNFGDERAKKLSLLVKYGSFDEKEIWMLRYGFSYEDIEWLNSYIIEINQSEIVFSENIKELSSEKIEVIKRFI